MSSATTKSEITPPRKRHGDVHDISFYTLTLLLHNNSTRFISTERLRFGNYTSEEKTNSAPMAHQTTSINAPLRQSNAYPTTSQQAIALTTRIEAKKAELENLSQLRDLSSALASQMQALEAKLCTLKDGTETIAYVLANWQSILQAINMASRKTATSVQNIVNSTTAVDAENRPSTLVRIPTGSIDTLPDA